MTWFLIGAGAGLLVGIVGPLLVKKLKSLIEKEL